MKELIFIRHAKSDWGTEFLKDIDRPLNSRGYLNAYEQFEWFYKNHSAPDLILCSTSTRTISTVMIYARIANYDISKIKLNASIYESSVETILSIIDKLDNSVNKIMIVGHNPFTTNICNQLNDDLFFENVPTCGIVSITFKENPWQKIITSKGKLNFHRFPKDYKND